MELWIQVKVVAVLSWKVLDPQRAALDVADCKTAIGWACQTALRDVIAKTMLEGRDKISDQLQKIIDARTVGWGITVISVEVKDVLIPPSRESAMSMQAQADRERQARVILGDSERQVAEKFGEASKTCAYSQVVFHLRGMNTHYEGLKQNSTFVIVPTVAVESKQSGGLAGLTALTMEIGKVGQTAKTATSYRTAAGPNGAPYALGFSSSSKSRYRGFSAQGGVLGPTRTPMPQHARVPKTLTSESET